MRFENLVIIGLILPVLFGAGSLVYVTFLYNALWVLPVSGLIASIIAAVLIQFSGSETASKDIKGGGSV